MHSSDTQSIDNVKIESIESAVKVLVFEIVFLIKVSSCIINMSCAGHDDDKKFYTILLLVEFVEWEWD